MLDIKEVGEKMGKMFFVHRQINYMTDLSWEKSEQV